MNCSPLRGVRAEQAATSPTTAAAAAASSPIAASAAEQQQPPLMLYNPLLDTSLDDEYAEQQHQQRQAKASAASTASSSAASSPAKPPKPAAAAEAAAEAPSAQTALRTLCDLAAESMPTSEVNSGADDDEEIEEARTCFSLPTPTPYHRATPAVRTPAVHQQQFFSSSPLPLSPFNVTTATSLAEQLVTPPPMLSHRYHHRHTAPSSASATAADETLQRDYKGTPIDRTMRRNLLAGPAATSVDNTNAYTAAVSASPAIAAAARASTAFRAAAAASLELVSPAASQSAAAANPLASPSKSLHMHRLEAQMMAASMHQQYQHPQQQRRQQSPPLSQSVSHPRFSPMTPMPSRSAYDSSEYSDRTPAAASAHRAVHLETEVQASLLLVEQSAVEEARDAVEEMGLAKEDHFGDHADNDHGDDDGDDFFSSQEQQQQQQEWSTPNSEPSQHSQAHPQQRPHANNSNSRSAALEFSPMPLANSASPFISPPPSNASARTSSHETRSAQQIRSSTLALAAPSHSPQPPQPHAPSSQEWSVPIELSKLAETHSRRDHSRYDLRHASRERKARATFLAQATQPTQATQAAPTAAAAAAATPLPKISPPTLEQWQRETSKVAPHAATTTTMMKRASTPAAARGKMQSSLALIKSKAAALKRSSPLAPAATTAAAAPKSAPAAAARSRSRSRPHTAAAAPRVPLASLPLNGAVVSNSNPWMSASENAAAATAEKQPFCTPIKRIAAAAVTHTPATVFTAEAENTAPQQKQVQQVQQYVLPAPLSPPSQPAQTYRALVNGVHILPPALEWVASHQVAPDRIHANMRFLTTARCAAGEDD